MKSECRSHAAVTVSETCGTNCTLDLNSDIIGKVPGQCTVTKSVSRVIEKDRCRWGQDTLMHVNIDVCESRVLAVQATIDMQALFRKSAIPEKEFEYLSNDYLCWPVLYS